MRIAADTNLLVRAIVGDDPKQEAAALRILADAELIAIPVTVFCELAWVLARIYKFSQSEIGAAIGLFLSADTVVTDHAAVEAGLAFLAEGCGFADGALANEGRHRGGVYFASFDRAAIKLLARQGHKTIEL